MWNHSWELPSVVTIRTDRGILYTVRQACAVCGTQRNPFNNVITFFPRARGCKQMMEGGEPPAEYSKELEHIRWVLEAHESDGDLVDVYHTGRKLKPVTAPELPLPYKD